MPLVLVDAFPTKDIKPTAQTTTRHPNYNKLKDFIARCKIADINYLPSCKQIEEKEGIGRSSVSRHIKELVYEGWLRKVVLGNSNRSVYYQVCIDKHKAIEYRTLFTPTGRAKKNRACDNSVIIRGL